MSDVTLTDITAAVIDLPPDDWQNVLDFIRTAKGSAPTFTPEREALNQQVYLVVDLKDLGSLVETARLALLKINADECDSVADVLSMAASRLHDMLEIHRLRLKQLEAIAYPEDDQGGPDYE